MQAAHDCGTCGVRLSQGVNRRQGPRTSPSIPLVLEGLWFCQGSAQVLDTCRCNVSPHAPTIYVSESDMKTFPKHPRKSAPSDSGKYLCLGNMVYLRMRLKPNLNDFIFYTVLNSFSGAMKQLTGSYGSVFRVSSGMYLLGALVYCLTPLGFFKDPYKACRSAKHNKAKTTII